MAVADDVLSALAKVAPFQGLTPAELKAFFEGAAESSALKGAKLFAEGEPGDALLVLLSGSVWVTKKGVELATLGSPAVLGEMALLGGEVRSAAATVASDARLLAVSAKVVQDRLAAGDVATLKVVANLARVMGKRLALINEKLVDTLSGGKKREELADFGRILNRWSF